MTLSEISPSEAILNDLVHDLRQPLGNIETSAYVLNLLTDPAEVRAHEHLRVIEQQVARAAALLSEAAAELRRLRG
jgi:signal transduction histidine kinase